MSFAQYRHEFFRCNLRLTEHTSKGANLHFAVHRNDAASGRAFHNDMAATLPHLLKSEPFKRTLNLSARKMRQLRNLAKIT